jgi:hypothetical protein
MTVAPLVKMDQYRTGGIPERKSLTSLFLLKVEI